MVRSVVIIGWLLSSLSPATIQAQTVERETVIRNLTLGGVRELSAAEQQRILHDVQNQTRTHVRDSTYIEEIAERVRFEFQRRGYLNVLVEDPRIVVVAKSGLREIVDINIDVTAVDQYRLKDLRFTTGTVFSATELRAAFPIADSDIFDREKIALGLENLRQLYGRKGYVNFSAVPQTSVDGETHTISLVVDLDEGSEFQLGKLIIRGEESEPGAREKLLKTWESYEGRIYDFTLLNRFLRDLHARPGVKPEQIFEVSEDLQARVVNVYITLVKPPIF